MRPQRLHTGGYDRYPTLSLFDLFWNPDDHRLLHWQTVMCSADSYISPLTMSRIDPAHAIARVLVSPGTAFPAGRGSDAPGSGPQVRRRRSPGRAYTHYRPRRT